MSNTDYLRYLYVNRTDCYCIQLPTGGYAKIAEPLTDDKLRAHLDEKITIGTYQLNTESQVKWLCFDLDPEKLQDPQATAKQIIAVMRQKGTDGKPLVWDQAIVPEASRYPDNSYHVWVLFSGPVKAKVARWIALKILQKANLDKKTIEVFPKQNEVTPERPYGNFVKLPFGKHQVEKKFSKLLSIDTFEPQPLEALADKRGLVLSQIDIDTIERLSDESTTATAYTLPTKTRDITAYDADRLVEFLARYWVPGYRNELVISFCGFCIKKGKSHQSTRNIISRVCDVTATSNFDKVRALENVDYQFNNRRTLGNLKGKSGLRQIINAIDRDGNMEALPCH